MARIRTIKPDFWTDEKVVELSAFARLLFIGLWNFADDEGRMECSPKRIKMQILPADPAEVPRLLDELEEVGLVRRYSVEKTEYLQVVGFRKHQKVDRRSPSKLPPPPEGSPNPAESRRVPPTEGKGMEGKDTASATTVLETPPGEHQPLALAEAKINPETPAAILASVLVANGIKATPFHPLVVEWARDGLTPEGIKAAIAKARLRKGEGSIPVAYIDPILRDESKPIDSAWRQDDGKAEALARELGIRGAKVGEDRTSFHSRIEQALADRARRQVA